MSNSERGVLQTAAAIASALLGALLLLLGVAAVAALLIASAQAGGESWESLGARAAAEIGDEPVALLGIFGVDLPTLFAQFAAAQGLPAFGTFAREVLAALFVGVALFPQAGLTTLIAARSIWRLTPAAPRGLLRIYAGALTLFGAVGLVIASAPHLIWGLVLALGLLTFAALRSSSPVTPPYSA